MSGSACHMCREPLDGDEMECSCGLALCFQCEQDHLERCPDAETKMYIDEVRSELQGQGFDEEFIECALDDIRDGESVTLVKGLKYD